MASADPAPGAGLDAEADALLDRALSPKRRARARVAEALVGVEPLNVETPDGRVAAWRTAPGSAVLLVHGWEDDNALWGPMIDALTANGRPVLALDLPGHGHSEAAFKGAEASARAILAVTAALGPVDAVIGHSFGCIALAAALDLGLGVERAVMIAAPIPRNANARIDHLRSLGAPDALVDRALQRLAQRPMAAAEPYDVLAAASRMKTRALFVHSLDDEQCLAEDARRLASAWPGADALYLDGLGHRFVAQDAEVTRRAADFVDGFGDMA